MPKILPTVLWSTPAVKVIEWDVVVTADEIRNGNDEPPIVVPAPGVRSYLDIVSVGLQYRPGAVAFDNDSELRIGLGTDAILFSSQESIAFSGLVPQVVAKMVGDSAWVLSREDVANIPIRLLFVDDNPGGDGDGTLRAMIFGRILNLGKE